MPPSALPRDLAALTEPRALARAEQGRQVYYRANPDCPIFEELKGIATKTFGGAAVLNAILAPHASGLRLAFLYGSIAKGTATSKSDVDLLWVGDLRPSELVVSFARAKTRLARKISVIASPEAECAAQAVRGSHFRHRSEGRRRLADRRPARDP